MIATASRKAFPGVMVTASAPPVLDRARLLVEPSMRQAIATLKPELAAIAEFHFGWVDEQGQQLPNSGGKGVRSALAVLSAEASGAPAEVAIPGAVAVELIHNFSLMHDDIIDGDLQRRHRPTVWALFGQDNAIIAGDALHTLAFEVLLGAQSSGSAEPSVAGSGSAVPGVAGPSSAEPTVAGSGSAEPEVAETAVAGSEVAASRAAALLASATAAMIAGQICDMSFNHRLDVSFQECQEMEANKTGALLGYAASIGAVLAGASSEVIAGLEHHGRQLGLAFQAADDLLGIWGDPAKTGKPVGNDLRERKKSLPVAYALAQETDESAELTELLASETLHDSQIERAAELVELAGGRDFTAQAASTYLQESLDSLDTVPLQQQPKAELAHLARFVIARDH